MSDLASCSPAPSGRNQRRFRRYLTLATATIVAPTGALDCAVLNVSTGGACLLVADAALVPDRFELLVDPDRVRVRCLLAWRGRHRVGVAFQPTDAGMLPLPHAWPATRDAEEA